MLKPFKFPILVLAGFGICLINACSNEKTDSNLEISLRPVRTKIVSNPDTVKILEFSVVVDASRKADLPFLTDG